MAPCSIERQPFISVYDAIRAAHVGCPLPLVTALAGYFDDSQSGDGIYVLAGYVAHVEVWDDVFVPAWRKALDEAPHKISEFKASDCRQQFNEFGDWTREERDALTKRMVSIVADECPYTQLVGLGAAVVVPHVEDPAVRRQVQDFGYLMCLRLIVHEALTTSAAMLGKDDRVQLIFDKQKGLVHRAYKHFETVQQFVGAELNCDVASPQFEDSKRLLPIQAADLLAYETYKEVKSRRDEPSRPPSRALCRLVESRFHRAYVVDSDLLNMAIAKQRDGVSVPSAQTPILYDSERLPLRGPGYWGC